MVGKSLTGSNKCTVCGKSIPEFVMTARYYSAKRYIKYCSVNCAEKHYNRKKRGSLVKDSDRVFFCSVCGNKIIGKRISMNLKYCSYSCKKLRNNQYNRNYSKANWKKYSRSRIKYKKRRYNLDPIYRAKESERTFLYTNFRTSKVSELIRKLSALIRLSRVISNANGKYNKKKKINVKEVLNHISEGRTHEAYI